MDDRFNLLEGIGLTKGEIKVYLSLLEIGSSTTGEIIKKAKVSRSKVYEMLERLINRGLVSFVIKGNIKYFEAADPTHLIHYIRREKSLLEEKEKELNIILPILKEKQKNEKKPQTATMYEGVKGIKAIYSDVIYSLNKGSEYYAITAEPEAFQDSLFVTFIENYHLRRAKRRIMVKLLAPAKIKEIISKTIAKSKFIQVRYFEQALPSALIIYGNNVANYVWGQEPSGTVIRSSIIAKRYRNFFEEVWKSSKP